MGFVIAPPWLGPALIATKKLGDWSAPGLSQLTLASFIEEGHLARHVRRMRGLYAPRRQALFDALGAYGAGWLKPVPSTTGLHLSARLTGPVTLDRVADAALAAGVVVERLDRYALAPAPARPWASATASTEPGGHRRTASGALRAEWATSPATLRGPSPAGADA